MQVVARGSGKGRARRSCEMGRDFQIYKMKSVTGWTVAMTALQCEWT